MLPILLAMAGFVPASRFGLSCTPAATTSRLVTITSRVTPPVTMIGGFKLPDLPSFGGGDDDFRLFPSDVEFTDVDGDVVVLRPKGGKIDFFVNRKLRISNANLVKNGNMLEITGRVEKKTGFLSEPRCLRGHRAWGL